MSTQRNKMADELFLLRLINANTKRNRITKPRTNPFDEYNDDEFRKRFRLSKATAAKLLEEVRTLEVDRKWKFHFWP